MIYSVLRIFVVRILSRLAKMDDDFYMDESGSLYDSLDDSPTTSTFLSSNNQEDGDTCEVMSDCEESDASSIDSEDDEKQPDEKKSDLIDKRNDASERKRALIDKKEIEDEVQIVVDQPKTTPAQIIADKLKKDTRDPAVITDTFYVNEKWPLKNTYQPGPKSFLTWYLKADVNQAFLPLKTPVKSNGHTLTHLCLLCAELGESQALYSGHPKNRRRHLEAKHLWQEIVFIRIKELQDRTVRVIDTVECDKPQPCITKYVGEDPSVKFRVISTKFILSQGLPLDTTEQPLFREMIAAARELPDGVSSLLGGSAVRGSVKDLHAAHWAEFKNLIQSSECLGWSLVFDGWDWEKKYKILGATATMLRTADSGLELERFPLYFRLLKGNGEFDPELEQYIPFKTLSGAEDMAKIILNGFQHRGIPLDKFIGAKGDGASNAQACTELLNKKSQVLSVFNSCASRAMGKVETRCVVHALGMAIKGAIGYLGEKSEKSQIPSGPDDEILQLFGKVRYVVRKLKDGKLWNQLVGFAQTVSQKLPSVHIDMDVRWISFYQMLEGFLGALPVYLAFKSQNSNKPEFKSLPSFDDQETSILGEIKGLLQPLMVAISFMESSDIPIMPLLLPMLAVILETYGALDREEGLLASNNFVDPRADQKKFAVTRFRKEGPFVVPFEDLKKVQQLERSSQKFYGVLQEHLIYRLRKERRNRNPLDLAAAWCDPVGRAFQSAWAGEDETPTEDLDETMKELVRRFAGVGEKSKAAKSRTAEEPGSSSEPSDQRILKKKIKFVPPTDLFEAECEYFLAEAEKLVAELGPTTVTVDNLINVAKKLNPLCFWDNKRRGQFPNVFKVAAFAICGSAHTCLQESVFSSAGDTLTQRR